MSLAIVIPARYESTRLSRKLLRELDGKPIISRVVDNALDCSNLDGTVWVVVATDSSEISDVLSTYAGKIDVVMTGECASGTDRVAKAASGLPDEFDVIVNLQGDEPFLTRREITEAVKMVTDKGFDVGTLSCAIESRDEYESSSAVKVLADGNGRALYFTRFPVPYSRQDIPSDSSEYAARRHIGLYVYRRNTLVELAGLERTAIERGESLEQLRFMEHGRSIGVADVEWKGFGIDTEEDLQNAERFLDISKRRKN